MEGGGTPNKGASPEEDLDYLSRPENYTGSNFQTMKRVVLSTEPEEQPTEEDDENKISENEAFLYKRYWEIFPTEEELKQREEEARKSLKQSPPTFRDIVELKVGVNAFSTSGQTQGDKDMSPEGSRRLGSSNLDVFGLKVSTGQESSGPRLLGLAPLGETPSMSQLSKKTLRSGSSRFGSVSKEVKARIARERFRHACKLVRTICKWVSAIIKKDKSPDDSMSTFTALVKEYSYENLKNSGLHFDPAYFKAKVEINLSTEVKNILSLPSEARTPEQIQTAMYGLRSLRSFAEYPLHMQEKLCKVAWFATVTPKRKIIRQGHLAENFYFILSGQAVVTILVKDPNTGESVTRTATIMRRGMSFGELALLHHSRRTATVTTQENVQLLTIGRDDFFDIFMSGQGPDQIPDHIKFVGQLEFMKFWPLNRLVEHPEQCLLHFFKRNAVIVKDSLQSDWIYIVKSGSCQVIKTLKGVKAKLGRKVEKDDSDFRLPKLGIGEQGPRVDTGLRPGQLVDLPDVLQRAVAQFKELANIKRKPEECDTAHDETKLKQEVTEPVAPKTGPGFSKSKFDKFTADTEAYFRKRAYAPKERLRDRLAYKPAQLKKPKSPPKVTLPPLNKPPPVFVQVESLKPRDVFGLEAVQFDNDLELPKTTVSLVSRGAECIMLSKEFFAKHANEAVRQMLRKHTRPYPEEDTFQENLQIKEDWNLYKATLIEDIMTSQKERKSLPVTQYG